jgi:RNA polymerase sigma-70 factor, ECF subfamily
MNGTTTATTTPEMLNTAFENIFEQFHQMVYRAAYKVLGRPEDAEDVEQHLFLRLMRSGVSIDRIDNLKSYLYRMAVNEALCIVRYRGLREVEEANLDDIPDPVTELSDGEIRGPLLEALAKLSPEAYQMLSLQQEGYDHAEIAETFGKSKTAVAMKLFHTRRRLKKLIGNKTRRTK